MTAVTGASNQELINNYIAQQEAAKKAEEATTVASEDKTALLGNYDTFLQILTTQIKNQDPTEPMDASKFTDQLVQYSAVEQQINTNAKLDLMLQNQNSNGITPLMSYVGQYAEVATSGDKMVVQGGKGLMAYNLPANTQTVTISVQDSKGNVVGTIQGPTDQGLNRVAWDGKMANGQQAPDGVYKYVLTAKNSSGDTLEIKDVRAIGQVTGVETDANGDVSLKIGDLFVDDKDVKSVFANIGVEDDSSSNSSSS